MMEPRSLQGRLTALLLALVCTVWLMATATAWWDARHELDELLDGHLAQAAALLVAQQSHELDEDAHLDAPTLHRYAPKVAFQIFHKGQALAHSANAPAQAFLAQPGSTPRGFQTVVVDGVAWRVFATTGRDRDVQVFVGEQVESRSAILMAWLRSTLWPMLVALPVLGLAIGWSVHQGVQPLRRLGQLLQQRPALALEPVELAHPPSEMAPMLAALNDLLQRIGVLMQSERRFTADAAHELRTPIAAIRAQAEVALHEKQEDARQHALQATLLGCDRASRLIDQLLTLARLESGEAPPMTPVDLRDVARGAMADLAMHALGKQQTLELAAPTPCLIQGNGTLLAALVRNLIDNAIRYSPPAAHIQASLMLSPQAATLCVQDSGPGLSEADQARMGERFFRVAGTAEAGSGLGWSIVRRIAQAHHAQVQLGRSEQWGGLRVEVSWPIQSSSSSS